MNITSILRAAWRITLRAWPLWVLTAGLGIVFTPAFTLGGAMGGFAAMLTLAPSLRGPEPEWIAQIRSLPTWTLVAGWIIAMVLLVLTSALTYLLQAAIVRGASLAAERGAVTLGEVLQLGWRRVINILALSLTLGGLILVISLLPWLVVILIGQRFQEAGAALLQVVQGLTAPVSSALGMAVFLMLMAIAIEDVRPRAAPGRAWAVFRKGWWAFLLVFAVSALISLPIVALILPIFVLFFVTFPFNQALSFVVLALCCSSAGVIGGAYLIFTFVFTTVLYTLVYREAARLAGPETPPVT